MAAVVAKYRLVAYAPFGDRLGVLPRWTSYETTDQFCNDATLRMSYPVDAAGFEYLEGEHEVAVETYEPDNDAWSEHQNGRLRLSTESRDPADQAPQVRSYTYTGIGSLLHRVLVLIPTPSDDADGDERPVRKFLDKTVGFVLETLLDEAQAAGYIPGITFTFGPVNDSDNEPWPDTYDFEFPVEMSLHAILQEFVDTGLVEYSWTARQLRMYLPRTFLYRDLTDNGTDRPDNPVTIRYGQGVSTAPTTMGYDNIVSRVLVLTERGRFLQDEDPTSEGPWGPQMRAVSASGTADSDVAQAVADEALRIGHNRAEQIRREIDSVTAGFHPYVDYRCGDRVLCQRGTADDGEFQNATLRVSQIMISCDDKGTQYHLTLGDRRTRLIERAATLVERLTSGVLGGHAGPIAKPGIDERIPTAPTNIVATPELFLNQAGKSRVRFAVTVTTAATTINPDTLVVEDLNLGSVDLFYQAGATGGYKRVQSWEDPAATVLVDKEGAGFDPVDAAGATITHHFMAKSRSHSGVKSAMSADFTASQAADTDPVDGATLVRDAQFQSQKVRDARAAAAGAGFTWVATSGQYRGRFTSPVVLNTEVAETVTAGQKQVTPGEEYIVSAKAQRIGGTSVSAQAEVRWFDNAGATISTSTVFTTATTTSPVVYEGLVTAPATAARAAVRLTGASFVGGATLEVWEPRLDRRTVESRMSDNSASTRVYITDSITEPKQAAGSTSTRVLADGSGTEPKHADNSASTRVYIADSITEVKQAAGSTSTRVLADLAVTNPKTGDDAQDPRTVGADAIETVHIAAAVHIDGTITAGNATLGGASASELEFAGGATIGDTGSDSAIFGMTMASFSGSGQFTGTWLDTSTRESKVNIRPLALDRAKALLGVRAVTFKRRDSWMRALTERVIPAKDLPERWEKDPGRPGKKIRAKAKRIAARKIPGRTDPKQYAGLIVEELAEAGIEEAVGRDAAGNLIGIDYGKLTPFLLTLVQDLYRQVEDLRGQKDQSSGSAPSGA